MKKLGAIFLLTLFVFSCASQPDDIGAIYVSPAAYSSYDCTQVETALRTKNTRLSQLYSKLKDKSGLLLIFLKKGDNEGLIFYPS